MDSEPAPRIFAGIAAKNPSLYRRLGVALGDPAAWIEFHDSSVALVRDLEMDRVRSNSDADQVVCPADYSPQQGLDSDRETATAQAVAEMLRRKTIDSVVVDRTLPFSFAWQIQKLGIQIEYDPQLGVTDRRQKSDAEIEALKKAQGVTEEVMQIVCHRIATADVAPDGSLLVDGQPLTSESVRSFAAREYMDRDYSMAYGAIVATAPQVADCHHSGTGPLHTGVPVIVDLFPMNNQSRYWGDCTRTVVNGDPSDEVKRMHQAVVEAKRAAEEVLRVGNTADAVHKAADAALRAAGYPESRGTITDEPSIQHGTGHGIGLDVHEPILLDHGGGALLEREVFTVEPGLYGRNVGGVRVEDMLVVRDGAPENLNQLHQGLDWR